MIPRKYTYSPFKIKNPGFERGFKLLTKGLKEIE